MTCPVCKGPTILRSGGEWCPRCRGWIEETRLYSSVEGAGSFIRIVRPLK